MGANPTGRAGRHGHLVVELRIRGELTAAVSRSATEAVESHGTRLISPCRGLGTNSKFEVVIPPRILSNGGATPAARSCGQPCAHPDDSIGSSRPSRRPDRLRSRPRLMLARAEAQALKVAPPAEGPLRP